MYGSGLVKSALAAGNKKMHFLAKPMSHIFGNDLWDRVN